MASASNNRSSDPPAAFSTNSPDTEFKMKYGPMPGNPNDSHSGLTPILPFISGAGISKSDGRTLRREQKQRRHFRGFTAKELLDLDANITTTRSLKPSDLNVPILPFLKRSRWIKKGRWHAPRPLGVLGSGDWVANNDLVWNILQPTFQLVSLIFENINTEYYDTMLHGPRTPINPDRYPANPPEFAPPEVLDRLRSFDSRGLPPQDTAPKQQSKDDLLNAMGEYVRFKFKDISEKGDWNGVTMTKVSQDANGQKYPNILIVLEERSYKPLFQDITASERFAYQWITAVTLAHECSHAMQRISEYYKAKRDQTLESWVAGPEPYYLNEPIQECGFVLEHYALGGITRGECNPKGSFFPTIASFWTEWGTSHWAGYRTNIILKNPPLNPRYHFYPIPVTHLEDVHQIDFWNHIIKAFGPAMLGLRSLKVRMQYDDLPDKRKRLNIDAGQSWGSHWRSLHAALKSKQDMSVEERRACNAGDMLIERAKLSEKFFIKSGIQSDILRHILDFNETLKEKLQAATAPGTTIISEEEVEESMQKQYNMILDAAKTHCEAVDTYLALANSGEAPIEIQRDLLLFNQGFRGFAREISKSWTGEFIDDYQYIDELLEFRRQLLYHPNDKNSHKFPIEGNEFGEINAIIAAYSRIGTEPEQMKLEISNITDAIEKRWVSSRYVRACAKIARLATDIVMGETANPEGAITEIDNEIKVLISLKNGEDGKPCLTWKGIMDKTIREMEKIVEHVRPMVMVPDTKDVNIRGYDSVNLPTDYDLDEDDIPTDNEMDEDDIPTDNEMDEDDIPTDNELETNQYVCLLQ